MNEFDRLDDWFNGIGEQRTLLSGTWKRYLNEVCKELYPEWRCLAAWDDGDGYIHWTTQDPHGFQTIALIGKSKVSKSWAVRVMATAEWAYYHPPKLLAKEGFEIAPVTMVQHALWMECWEQCDGDESAAQRLYESLGGEMDE